MESFLPYLSQLGLPGILALLLLALAQLGLVQFARTALSKLGKPLQGGAVLVLSLILGAVLGWLMLSRVAAVAGIDLPPPLGGIALGMVLAAIVSGLVSYRQQRSAEKAAGAVTPDVLAGLFAQMAQQSAGAVVAAPVTLPTAAPPAEVLTPITPEQASQLTSTSLADVPLDQPLPGWLQTYQTADPPDGSGEH